MLKAPTKSEPNNALAMQSNDRRSAQQRHAFDSRVVIAEKLNYKVTCNIGACRRVDMSTCQMFNLPDRPVILIARPIITAHHCLLAGAQFITKQTPNFLLRIISIINLLVAALNFTPLKLKLQSTPPATDCTISEMILGRARPQLN